MPKPLESDALSRNGNHGKTRFIVTRRRCAARVPRDLTQVFEQRRRRSRHRSFRGDDDLKFASGPRIVEFDSHQPERLADRTKSLVG